MNQYINRSSKVLCRFLFFLVLSGLLNLTLQGQKVVMIQVEGRIVNEAGEPIQGAMLHAREGALVVKTDETGGFTAEIGEKDMVLIEAEGYNSQVLDAINLQSAGSIILFRLPFHMSEEDDVNVPFGVQKKRQITGAVSSIDPKEILKYDARQSVYGALNSRVPGLMGNLNNRGIGQALVVVDGIPRPANNFNLQEVEQITYLNHLAWLNAVHKDVDDYDPNEAVKSARLACEFTGFKRAYLLDTLAIDYAAAGNFSDSVRTAEKALEFRNQAIEQVYLILHENMDAVEVSINGILDIYNKRIEAYEDIFRLQQELNYWAGDSVDNAIEVNA